MDFSHGSRQKEGDEETTGWKKTFSWDAWERVLFSGDPEETVRMSKFLSFASLIPLYFCTLLSRIRFTVDSELDFNNNAEYFFFSQRSY